MMRSLRCVLLTLLVTALLAAGAAVLAAWRVGYWLEAPGQAPKRADAIAVLGGDEEGERATRAIALYRQGFAPVVVLTGLEMGVAPIPADLNWRAQFMEERGVPRSAMHFERQAYNSLTEAEQLREMMRREGWRTLIVVSDPPHMRRLAWVYANAFDGSNVEVVFVASRPVWWQPGTWWRVERSGQFVLQELIKLGYYGARKWRQ